MKRKLYFILLLLAFTLLVCSCTTSLPSLPPISSTTTVVPTSNPMDEATADEIPASLFNQLTYSFNQVTPQSTKESSGTGGTKWHEEKEYSLGEYFIYDFDYRTLGEDFLWTVQDYEEKFLRVVGMPNTVLQEAINNFLLDAFWYFHNLGYNYSAYWFNSESAALVGVTVDAFWHEGEIYHHTSLSAVFSTSNSQQLQLSDLFYDEINYVVWLNKELSQLTQRSISPSGWKVEEGNQKRPFSGIAADYPFFRVTGYYDPVLEIHFPESNPFFSEARVISVPLEAEVSPYGKKYPFGQMNYVMRQIPSSELWTLLVPEISLKGFPHIASIVNAAIMTQVEELSYEKLFTILEEYITQSEEHEYGCYSPADHLIYPIVDVGGPYLSLSFQHQHLYSYQPSLLALCFDLRDGEMVDLGELYEILFANESEFEYAWELDKLENGSWSGGRWYEKGEYNLPQGFLVTSIIFHSEREAQVEVQEPLGRYVRFLCSDFTSLLPKG